MEAGLACLTLDGRYRFLVRFGLVRFGLVWFGLPINFVFGFWLGCCIEVAVCVCWIGSDRCVMYSSSILPTEGERKPDRREMHAQPLGIRLVCGQSVDTSFQGTGPRERMAWQPSEATYSVGVGCVGRWILSRPMGYICFFIVSVFPGTAVLSRTMTTYIQRYISSSGRCFYLISRFYT